MSCGSRLFKVDGHAYTPSIFEYFINPHRSAGFLVKQNIIVAKMPRLYICKLIFVHYECNFFLAMYKCLI